jgi:hypothetical protein
MSYVGNFHSFEGVDIKVSKAPLSCNDCANCQNVAHFGKGRTDQKEPSSAKQISSLDEPDLTLPQPLIEPLSVLDNTNVLIFSLEENSGSSLYEWNTSADEHAG